ncbi:MAG: flagellar hook-basal body complex protein, partial [Duganella sp.]
TPTTPPETNTFNMSKATVLYDTLGGKHTMTQYFRRDATDPNLVKVDFVVDGSLVNGATTQLKFNTTTGSLESLDGTAATAKSIDLTAITLANGGKLNTVSVDYAGTTGFAGEATTSSNSADGYASGTFTGVALSADGSLIASYTNGQKQTVGRIALATFANEGALTNVSDTSWVESVSSGTALVNAPGVGVGGNLTVSSLEQSNVDITSELVGLMTSQRNYQANSKVIQTESTMLQSLMQAI